jgi:hypothetical protein
MKKSNWIQYIAIFLTVINLCILGATSYNHAQAATTITVPTLPKGEGYEVEINTRMPTCVDLETSLGLPRGAIVQISDDPSEGKVVITFNKDQKITAGQLTVLESIVNKYIKDIKTK